MSNTRFPLIFGEILFDCFSDGQEKLGGAPFNVAWHLQALGMLPEFISKIGDDSHGQYIQDKMNSWGMSTKYLQLDKSHPTGTVQVELNQGEPEFSILKDQAYDYIEPIQLKIDNAPPLFLYHGSLAIRNNVSRDTLFTVKRDSHCPIFIDVNLRNPWWNKQTIYDLLEDITWLKLNEDELQTLFFGSNDPLEMCASLVDRFALEGVFLTMGDKGAAAFTLDGTVSVTPQKDVNIVDTVGAGDAFSSVLLLGLSKEWPLQTIMERAQDFASAVVGIRGAISEDKSFYESFQKQWDL